LFLVIEPTALIVAPIAPTTAKPIVAIDAAVPIAAPAPAIANTAAKAGTAGI
jgi:hypothetical protein